jgi:hypothetical protein
MLRKNTPILGQTQQKRQQEDPTKKLEKYADLRQKGLLTEEEFQKLKADLLSQTPKIMRVYHHILRAYL